MKGRIYLERVVPLFGAALNRVRYRGLWTGLRVEIRCSGRFHHGDGVRLGEGSRIDVPPESELDIGSGVIVGRNVYFSVGSQGRIGIGANTSVQDSCRIMGHVTIGRGCIFAPNVFISSGTHTFDAVPHLPIREQERSTAERIRPVRIFDDCWLGINVVVTPGVTIGRGCVVGANAVVTGDLPPYSVAGGIPARVLKARFPFSPKARIDASCPEDIPYFYDGFHPTSANDHFARAADKQFVLALARSTARTIRLNLAADTGEIQYQDQSQGIPPTPGTLEFDRGAGASPFLTFRTDSPCRIYWAELS